ncbi:MAG: hypothetical protein AAFN70_17080 [Planctomycetota bacterium]
MLFWCLENRIDWNGEAVFVVMTVEGRSDVLQRSWAATPTEGDRFDLDDTTVLIDSTHGVYLGTIGARGIV